MEVWEAERRSLGTSAEQKSHAIEALLARKPVKPKRGAASSFIQVSISKIFMLYSVPRSAFLMFPAAARAYCCGCQFVNEKRAATQAANPDLSMVDISRELGKIWQLLNDGEKQPYIDAANAEKEAAAPALAAWKEEMAVWKAEMAALDPPPELAALAGDDGVPAKPKLFNQVVLVEGLTPADARRRPGEPLPTEEAQEAARASGEPVYYYVLTYIPDLYWCRVAPMRQVGVFDSSREKSTKGCMGRAKWMLQVRLCPSLLCLPPPVVPPWREQTQGRVAHTDTCVVTFCIDGCRRRVKGSSSTSRQCVARLSALGLFAACRMPIRKNGMSSHRARSHSAPPLATLHWACSPARSVRNGNTPRARTGRRQPVLPGRLSALRQRTPVHQRRRSQQIFEATSAARVQPARQRWQQLRHSKRQASNSAPQIHPPKQVRLKFSFLLSP